MVKSMSAWCTMFYHGQHHNTMYRNCMTVLEPWFNLGCTMILTKSMVNHGPISQGGWQWWLLCQPVQAVTSRRTFLLRKTSLIFTKSPLKFSSISMIAEKNMATMGTYKHLLDFDLNLANEDAIDVAKCALPGKYMQWSPFPELSTSTNGNRSYMIMVSLDYNSDLRALQGFPRWNFLENWLWIRSNMLSLFNVRQKSLRFRFISTWPQSWHVAKLLFVISRPLLSHIKPQFLYANISLFWYLSYYCCLLLVLLNKFIKTLYLWTRGYYLVNFYNFPLNESKFPESRYCVYTWFICFIF